jgi:hypothetical protein
MRAADCEPLEGAVLRKLKEIFLELIEDYSFRIFPWYVPLFDKGALTQPMYPLTNQVMQNIPLYIRESPEDGGILIASAEPLTKILRHLGCEEVEDGPATRWKLV